MTGARTTAPLTKKICIFLKNRTAGRHHQHRRWLATHPARSLRWRERWSPAAGRVTRRRN